MPGRPSDPSQATRWMRVMPANCTGGLWVSLARETGRLGHLYSPGSERGPWPWFPYALDNGCFSLWNRHTDTFDEDRWRQSGVHAWRRLLLWGQTQSQKPLWAIVPDRPGQWEDTAKKWSIYAPEIAACGIPLAIAVQNGANPSQVRQLDPVPNVIAVGGNDQWKWESAEMWLREFPRVHLLRCNRPNKLAWLESLGCESADGTGWGRGDRKQFRGLEDWARGQSCIHQFPLWPHVSRPKSKNQLTFL